MNLRTLATETLSICAAGEYRAATGEHVVLRDALTAAREGTTLYRPADVAELPAIDQPGAGAPRSEVTNETTTAALRRLYAAGVEDALALNFASARNVGGGFLGGARAQEEDLCRTSALFPCLETQPTYYAANRAHRSCLYTDHAIYSPRVPFFRDDALALQPTLAFASVLTMPAPNAAELTRNPGAAQALEETFRARARAVVRMAASRGHRTLLLGAWGCGAFRNSPVLAADAFARALADTAQAFDLVLFAVWERSGAGPNFAAFRERFG
jgi:uncharacterized protein (TIGR02452 family)